MIHVTPLALTPAGGASPRRLATIALGLCPLAAGVSGCAERPAAPVTTTRDSAGIVIVESAAPAWPVGEGWTVDTAAVLDLTRTGEGPEHELFRVQDVLRLTDGSFAVALPTEIRLFSRSGEYIATVGREGEGPGEFLRLSRLVLLEPDSLIAYDYWQRRAMVYGPGLEVARVVRFDREHMRRESFDVLDDGFVFMESWPSVLVQDAPIGLVRMPLPVLRATRTGEIVDTVAIAAGSESVRLRTERGIADAMPAFGRDSHLAVHQGRIVLGDAVGLDYRVLGPTGEVERIVRASFDTTLPQDILEAERHARLGDDPSPTRIRFWEDLPIPADRPAYAELVVDATGAVWLKEHRGELVNRLSEDLHPWEVFSPEGVWLGPVALPANLTVFEIGADYVLGVFPDELDVEHVAILPLSRSPDSR
ncbi:MAG: 6-bladed beta-propeller [Gemmatimonadota bacterium]|nr:6-bladed beta-propeller [Gemmatimonadota bacterium]